MKNIRLIVCFGVWSCVSINASDGRASFVYKEINNNDTYVVKDTYNQVIALSSTLENTQYDQSHIQLKQEILRQAHCIDEQKYIIDQLVELNNQLVLLGEQSGKNTQKAIQKMQKAQQHVKQVMKIDSMVKNKIVYYEWTFSMIKRMLEVGIVVGLYATYNSYQSYDA